ncbi:MAG: VWA domain-containing protein [Chitinophagaceae bacterium]|nr:MAG: VWA domain-containing protein [Chitinophagaceae bacterium]
MFSFEKPESLYFLLGWVLFLLIFLSFFFWRKKVLAKIGHSSTVLKMMPLRPGGKYIISFVLFSISFFLFVIALANPRVGTSTQTVSREGVDVLFLMDVSNSMMAEDIRPNRLERAKNFMLRTIGEMRGDRVGIVVFAGDAYLKLPLTGDYRIASALTQTLRPEMVPVQGTNIPAALERAVKSFEEAEMDHRVVVLITDAENHEGDIESAVSLAVSEGIRIFVAGIGTTEGAPIPVYDRRGIQTDYRRDANGSIVLTRFNEEKARILAESGNGKFINLQTTMNAHFELINEIGELEKREIDTVVYVDFESYFQYFLFAGFLFILIDGFIPMRKSIWWDKLKNKN